MIELLTASGRTGGSISATLENLLFSSLNVVTLPAPERQLSSVYLVFQSIAVMSCATVVELVLVRS
jgi:hypothetical protein